jgi:WD40-like Beta Propeller Repeat
MSARIRSTAAAFVVASALGGVALFGGTVPALAAIPVGTPAPATPHGQLTISDGSSWVLINGHWVNFGTIVRDLSWSPNGAKAAFVDGSGNLDVANPNGSDRVVVARNPGNQTWSHPTWQVTTANDQDGLAAMDNLIFTAEAKGVDRLDYVSATAVHGTPEVLSLNSESGPGVTPLPQTANEWASAAGAYGTSVYANTRTGDVYIRDEYTRQQGSALTQGSEPALSPNGEEIAFVRSVAGHDHLLVENGNGHITDLTPKATTDYTEPAWSSDGSTLAARTPTGTVTLAANGSGHPVKATSAVGLVAYRA